MEKAAFPTEWFLRKKKKLFVCVYELAVPSLLTLQDLIKCIYKSATAKADTVLRVLWSCCQQNLLAYPFIMRV